MLSLPSTSLTDTYKTRKVKIGDNFVTLFVENTLPMYITLDSVITNAKTLVKTEAGAACNTDIESYDDTETDRFISISTVTSPLTYNKLNFYYDKKYSDILITPNLEFSSLVSKNNLQFRCYRLGNNNKLSTRHPLGKLGMEKSDYIKLPEAKANTGMKVHLVSLPGFHSENIMNTTRFEETEGNFNILHIDRALCPIIELGTGSALFTDTNLHVYLLAQDTFVGYGIESIARQDVASKKLYLNLRF